MNVLSFFSKKRQQKKRIKVKIVSPKAPSGASWLINALICLGIRVGRSSSPEPGTFVKGEDGLYVLNKAESNLKLHFPALSESDAFLFREDIIVEWAHDWPSYDDDSTHIFLFVRDPRDTLYSYYRRRNASVDFTEFLYSIDYVTLLDQVRAWRLYIDLWMKAERVSILRFEDFKQNPHLHIQNFIEKLGISSVRDEDICNAIASSSVENAKKKEQQFIEGEGTFFKSGSSLNRKGMSYEWESQFNTYRVGYETISEVCSRELLTLGYKELPTTLENPALESHKLKYFGAYFSKDDVVETIVSQMPVEQVRSILSFYLDYLESDKMKYGYFEQWEHDVFHKKILSLVEIYFPDLSRASQGELPASSMSSVISDLLYQLALTESRTKKPLQSRTAQDLGKMV